jgi:hypothetical protein
MARDIAAGTGTDDDDVELVWLVSFVGSVGRLIRGIRTSYFGQVEAGTNAIAR